MAYPRNPELEREIIASPDDDAPRLVYGDWLQSHGDSWGELIVLQSQVPPDREPLWIWDDPTARRHAVRQRPHDTTLFYSALGTLGSTTAPAMQGPARERELREELLDEALGPYAHSPVRVRWRCGFIDGVFAPQRGCSGDDLPDFVAALLDHRAAIALRELGLGAVTWDSGRSYHGYSIHYEQVIELLELAAPVTLEKLALGAWAEHDISWTAIGDLRELSVALPNLRVLELQGNGLEWGELDWPKLERLLIRSGGLPGAVLDDLARAHLPALTDLTLWFGVPDYGGCDDVAVAEPFLRANERHPRLRRLGLANALFTDELCARLPSAPVLPQLTHLDLSMGTMSDESARSLLAAPRVFAHLEYLDLRGNSLSEKACAELARLGPRVDTRFQDTSWRYVTVSE